MPCQQRYRITSYNVCYTKLLRDAEEPEFEEPPNPDEPPKLPPEEGFPLPPDPEEPDDPPFPPNGEELPPSKNEPAKPPKAVLVLSYNFV